MIWFKRIFIILLLFILIINPIFILKNLQTYEVSGQSKYFFIPQNTTIAIISEPEGFTKVNTSSEILKGILAIKNEFTISVLLFTPESFETTKNEMKKAVENHANIIVATGEKIRNDFISFASENPDTFFIGIDMFSNDIDMEQFLKKPTPRNLNFLLYKEEEAGFLAGIFAGLITKDYNSISNRLNPDNIVGLIIANKNDIKYRYEFGFRLGVLAINDKCQIISSELDDETDLYLIRKSTGDLYQKNADIVFQLCGTGSAAAIQSAYLNNNFIIGYEIDQNIYAPSNVVTSAIKKISSSIYYYIKRSFLYGFISGILRLGIKDGAVGLASFHEFDLIIPSQIKDSLYTASTAIAEGKINIPFVSLTLKDEIEQQQNVITTSNTTAGNTDDNSTSSTNSQSYSGNSDNDQTESDSSDNNQTNSENGTNTDSNGNNGTSSGED